MNREELPAELGALVRRVTPTLDPLLAADWLGTLFHPCADPLAALCAAPPEHHPRFIVALQFLYGLCNQRFGAALVETQILTHLALTEYLASAEQHAGTPFGESNAALARVLARTRRTGLLTLRVWCTGWWPEAVERGWLGLLDDLPGVPPPKRPRRAGRRARRGAKASHGGATP